MRLIDSGEADTNIYNAQMQSMVPNMGPLASGDTNRPVQKGVLQIKRDHKSGREMPIMRISTNKTADINKDAWNKGYDCPYAPEDVVNVLAWLRDWQTQYNLISGPTRWEDVHELKNIYTANQLKDMQSCFLFRDPATSNRTEPLSDKRIRNFWLQLVGEMERRLEAQNIRQPDGQPYKLISEDGKTPIYDLHSLRVTGITAMYEHGVQSEILMKIVGHATVVMTLYYVKFSEYEIQQVVDKAMAERMRHEQENWTTFQRQRRLSNLEAAVVWNDESGLEAFSCGSGASLLFMDTGICPVGGQKCHIGGEEVGGVSNGKESRWRPVPGGKSNCAACRFFISGPPFLHGLVAQHNSVSAAASDKAFARTALQVRFDELDAERRSAQRAGEVFLHYREWSKTSTDYDAITEELDRLLLRMNAVSRVVEQCRKILVEAKNGNGSGTHLIINDISSLEVAFEETTEFDLLDRICSSATIFQSIDATYPNIKRQRAYDRMLTRNGLQPAFLDLDEATSLRVGNELSRLLTARIGRENTLKLMEGQETLVRLGVTAPDLEQVLVTDAGKRLKLRSRPHEIL